MSWNKFLIRINWVALVIALLGTPINVGAYLMHVIDEQALILITLILSWWAIILAALGSLITSLVKDEVGNA